VKDCLLASGGNYGPGYTWLMSLPVSELIWHVHQWIELQKQLHPETDPHAKAGVDGDFELYEG
jgi:hypothetical protein